MTGRKEETKVSLPVWLDRLIRRLWDTEGASFAELIKESLQTDAARPLSEDEAVSWRRQQRLRPGVRQRTLRLDAGVTEQLQKLVEKSAATDMGLSTMIAVLLSKHPSIVALQEDEKGAEASTDTTQSA